MARQRPKSPTATTARVPIVLYTRAACHLCEQMKGELTRSGLIPPGALREVDIDQDEALATRYGRIIPVLEIGGRIAFRARIRPGTLKRRLGRLMDRFWRAGPGPGPRPYPAATPHAEPPTPPTPPTPGPPGRSLPLPATEPLPQTLRVLLVDDHELVRSALAGAISQQAGFEVACVASSANEALERIGECDPGLLVMDIDMPGMICFDAVRRMREERPELRVIFLSAFFHDHYIEQALQVGANGYVVKGGPLETLFEALQVVAGGGDFFSPQVRSRILTDPQGGRHLEAPTTRVSTVTARELEVLRYLARGLSKKEIASTMKLSVKTVEHHAAGLMRKLDIHDRVELARYAIREGLAEA